MFNISLKSCSMTSQNQILKQYSSNSIIFPSKQTIINNIDSDILQTNSQMQLEQSLAQSLSQSLIKIHYSKSCNQRALSYRIGQHPSAHDYMSYPLFTQILTEYMKYQPTPALCLLLKETTQMLQRIKAVSTKLLQQLNNLNKGKFESHRNLMRVLIQARNQQLINVKCSQVYQLYQTISTNQMESADLVRNHQKVINNVLEQVRKVMADFYKFDRKVSSDIMLQSQASDQIKVYNQSQSQNKKIQWQPYQFSNPYAKMDDDFKISISSISQSQRNQKKQIKKNKDESRNKKVQQNISPFSMKKQEKSQKMFKKNNQIKEFDQEKQKITSPKKQKKVYISKYRNQTTTTSKLQQFQQQKQQSQQNSSIAHYSQYFQTPIPQVKQKSDKSSAIYYKNFFQQKLLNIKQAKNSKKNDKFTIKLKIIKILRTFMHNGLNRVVCSVWDQTGTSIGCFNDSKYIKLDNFLEITNCILYDFKGEKQIQNTKTSKYRQIQQKQIKGTTSKNLNSNSKQSQKQSKKCTKIAQIKQPTSQPLNMVAQIYKIFTDDGQNIKCQLGDQTGIINAQLPAKFNFIREGISVHLKNVYNNLDADDQCIVVEFEKGSRIQPVYDIKFARININKNVSSQKWKLASSDSD